MTQTGYTNAIVDTMLGWLKGLASWVLRLFNLSAGGSPLKFLADNWLQILIILLIVGVAADLLIWLIRWRPHWVWFRKKRVIINDKNFFAREHDLDDDGFEPRRKPQNRKPRRNWEDSEFVVPSTVVRRREDAKRSGARGDAKPAQGRGAAQAEAVQHTDVFQDDLFNVNAKQKFSDKYEDEVFNVSNLPASGQPVRERRRSDISNTTRRPEQRKPARRR